MNHKRVLAIASLAAVFATAATTARAAEVGFYIGGTYGQTDKEVNKQDFDAYTFNRVFSGFGFTPTSFSSSVDDSFNGYGFYGGYRFNRHLAVEGGYSNLGSFKYRARAMGMVSGTAATNAVFNYDGETAGITVSALGVWPLSYRWEVYGRGGVLFASNTATLYYADGIQGTARGELSENSVDMLAGIGTSFTVLEIYDLHLEYQRVFDAGDKAIGEGDADTISVGISVTF